MIYDIPIDILIWGLQSRALLFNANKYVGNGFLQIKPKSKRFLNLLTWSVSSFTLEDYGASTFPKEHTARETMVTRGPMDFILNKSGVLGYQCDEDGIKILRSWFILNRPEGVTIIFLLCVQSRHTV